MLVNRRTAIKNFLIISGGVLVIPSCMHRQEQASILLKNIKLDGSDEQLLSEVAETIIPATNTPGAKDLYTHLFTMKMVDDCYEKDTQDAFINGLHELNNVTRKQYKNDFVKCSPAQREALLTDLENKKTGSKDLQSFYSIMKGLTLRGYMTSKYVMTNLVKYELVPGRFHGTYPINKTNLA